MWNCRLLPLLLLPGSIPHPRIRILYEQLNIDQKTVSRYKRNILFSSIICNIFLPQQAELDGQSVGACTAHAHRCGAGIGLFLRLVFDNSSCCYHTLCRVRECKVVMFSGRTKGCYESPPYLDQVTNQVGSAFVVSAHIEGCNGWYFLGLLICDGLRT